MSTWSFVDSTDRPTGQTFTGPNSALAANTPDGCRAIEGVSLVERREDPDLRRDRVLAQIADQERRQARPQRELLLDPGNAEASRRLREIEAQIAQLRATLRS
jgi:hypothetical protein